MLAEANALAPGWGDNNQILQTANEIIVNRLTKAKIEEKRATLASEKEAWEKVREASRLELEGEDQSKKEKEVISASSTNASTPEKAKPKTAAVTEASDEDTVLVEKGADAATNAAGGGGGKNKKKKGRK